MQGVRILNRNPWLEPFLVSWQTINRHLRKGSLAQGAGPITRVQWLILRHLQTGERLSVGQLAEFLHVRASTMSQMLDRLERERLVCRTPDPKDSRTRLVQLTRDGYDLIRRIEAVWMERLAQPLQRLSPEEQATLIRLLGKLADYFSQSEDG
jgi:DNA-binding MarR family transcriptional regulator